MRFPELNKNIELEDFIYSIYKEIEISYNKVKLEKWIEHICGIPTATACSNFTFGVDYSTSSGTALSTFYSDVGLSATKPTVYHVVYNNVS